MLIFHFIYLSSTYFIIVIGMIVFIQVLIFTAGPSDFQLLSNQIIIPSTTAVGTPVCQPITILGDTVEEEDETFTVTASVTSPDTITQPDTITVTIVDDGDGMLEQCMVCLMNN